MKRVLLSVCLMAAAVCAPTNLHIAPAINLGAGDVTSKAMLLSHPCVQSTEQDEVHAVVVDMPKVISLSYASPDTWGDLPMSAPPYEQPPATGPARQLAMSVPD
jgi:hypothetical protein